jgi:hypothetical protein
MNNIHDAQVTRPKLLKTYSVLFRQKVDGEGQRAEITRSETRQRSVTVTAVDEYDAIAVASRGWGILPINVVDVRLCTGKPSRNDHLDGVIIPSPQSQARHQTKANRHQGQSND